jgi:hypothetical protein
LQQLANETGGRCTLMTPQDDIPEAVRKLACTLRRPVLTNLQLQDGAEIPSPERGLVDLHASEVLLVPVRVRGSGRVELTARLPDGSPWSMQWDLDQAEASETARLAWVKRRISQLQRSGEQAAAIELSTRHNLICRGTAFVAWDEAAQTAVAKRAVAQPSLEEPSLQDNMPSLRNFAAKVTSRPSASMRQLSFVDDLDISAFICDPGEPLAAPFKGTRILASPMRHAGGDSRLHPPLKKVPGWLTCLRKIWKEKFRLPKALIQDLDSVLLEWAGEILGRQRHQQLESWAGLLAQEGSTVEQFESLLDPIQHVGIQHVVKQLRQWQANQRA